MDKLLLGVLQNFHSEGLFVSPNIPRKKEENAYANYGMKSSIKVFAIVDATVFGSAKNGLAFTSEGLFWKNDWTTTSAKNHLSWEEFKSTEDARSVKGSELLLGRGCAFGMAGSGMKPKVLLQLMSKLASVMNDAVADTAPAVTAATPSVAASEQAVQPTRPVTPAPEINTSSKPQAQQSSTEPPFEGSYHEPHLHIVNAVAKRHRLASQVQIAPAIKVFKVSKVIEISAVSIKPYDILMIVDNTFLQTAKDFLVVTAQCLWAKGTLRKLDRFPLNEIRKIHCQGKNLYINDYDFQFFDQLTENEVLVLTNMLKELVGALREHAQGAAADRGHDFPAIIDDVLSGAYDSVINKAVTALRADNSPQARKLIESLAHCLFSAFYEVHVHLEHRGRDRGALLGQYLLAQTLASVVAFRGSDQLWDSIELRAMFATTQGQVMAQVLRQAQRVGITVQPNFEWYFQIMRELMDASTLEQGLDDLAQTMEHLTAAQEHAVECALGSVEAVQKLLFKGL